MEALATDARELVLTPRGHLALRDAASGDGGSPAEGGLRKLARAVERSQAEGLFFLAAQAPADGLSAPLAYFQRFGRCYLTEVCRTREPSSREIEPVPSPPREELAELALAVPPMPGAEYLGVDVLDRMWGELDAWVRGEAAAHEGSLAGFLKDRAALWHAVGRVCFHLAENRRDERYPFAFLATYSPGVSQNARVRYQPLGKALQEYAGAKNKPALVRLLQPVQRAAEQSAWIRELLESGDMFQPLAWTAAEAYRYLRDVPLLESSGVLIRLPDWWQKRPRPQVGVVIGSKRRKALGADAMLDFQVQLALGDEKITPKEWQQLMAADEGLVRLKGRWVEVDREKLQAALDHWKQVERAARDGELSFIDGMRLLAGAPAGFDAAGGAAGADREWSFVRAGEWLGPLLAQLRQPDPEPASARGLKAKLRPYQKAGVQWLHLLTGLGLGACLADDMGLGKTIQVLALLLKHKAQGGKKADRKPALLVLPASLLGNWKAELARFAPSLVTVFVHPSELDKASLARLADDPAGSLRGVDAVLTTYGMLQRQPWLQQQQWHLAVLDEAQAIKNAGTRQARAAKALRAASRVALTGTPVENRLSDLWSLFDFLCPGLLGSAAKFKQFVKTMESGARGYKPLRRLVAPYILRRLKSDRSIIADLPDKSEVRAFCSLSKRQAALYERSVQEMADVMEGAEGIQRKGLVLGFLLRFKQICNHPSQFLGDGEYRRDQSGKFARLAELGEEIASRQEKALVFTQFRELTGPLAEFLAGVFGQSGLVLHGGTAVKKRRTLIERFQREDGPPFFVLSLKAGGTGLNLTAASHVVHFDRWWNPAVENQATDRAYRIGQRRNVLVHKFVCRGTIEERIDEMIEEKQSLAADVLGGGAEKLLTEMSDKQLMELVQLDVNKALA